MKVLALTRYGRLGSSSRVRFWQFSPWLSRAGVDVHWVPLWRDAYLQRFYAGQARSPAMVVARYAARLVRLLTAHRFDVVWLEAELWPFLPGWVETALGERRVRLVVDYDDAVFHKYDQHRSRIIRRLLGGKIAGVMRTATVVIVGNSYLADYAIESGARRVEVIPSVVDTDRLRPVTPPPRTRPVVTWIGTAETARYLTLVAAPLRELVDDRVVDVALVGAGPGPHGFPHRLSPWSEDSEASRLCEADIGIMPLPDSPWERGKCGYKLLQYMACGLPVAASPVGVNAAIVDDTVGRRCTTAAEWEAALRELAGDGELRRRLGAAGRQRVVASYSLEGTAPRLAQLLVGVAAG